ncbi:hypothetical protein EPO05_07170 [Patescibacteria group bacterium]|nr:MAG: hypothetical protein EPO05_07170 [Patescibacteria group bacterium]
MKVTANDNQPECIARLSALGILEAVKLAAGYRTTDALPPLDAEDTWLIITYKQEQHRYILHTVENATLEEAFQFLGELRGNHQYFNPRIHLV